MTGTEAFHTLHAVTSAFFENSIVATALNKHKERCHLQHPPSPRESVEEETPTAK